ncbi:GLPGLI family protein [Tannerella serpentiformis]|uniref:GLPGLI family protein n=1 Tax=Tannerella serpentiformis TaxID=712710 RepID=UPI000840D0E9|nr:GLPGLI family protein [Tannerella serpentiformis]AOH40861.1 GLPGLI family protein [Tannerella serpentiformis]AVV52528.1 GLPGLI family protein [Tannerella serpentiformis]
MKVILYLLLTSLAVQATAREPVLDRAHMKCLYRYVYTFDTLKNELRDDLLILQIGKEVSKCYSYYTFQCDSLQRTPDGAKVWSELFRRAIEKDGIYGDFPHVRMSTYVYKNYPTGQMTITDRISSQGYCYVDSLHTQTWAMGDSTREVLGYTCQQATADFRGRRWTAWFATDIPISDGPWKLGGLPGLILKAYDEGQQHVFTAVGLERVKDEPIIFNQQDGRNRRFEPTNRLDFLRMERRFLMDSNSFIQMETGIDLLGDEPNQVMRYDLLERDY